MIGRPSALELCTCLLNGRQALVDTIFVVRSQRGVMGLEGYLVIPGPMGRDDRLQFGLPLGNHCLHPSIGHGCMFGCIRMDLGSI